MKQSTLIWTVVMVLGGSFLMYQTFDGNGRVYVRDVPVEAKSSLPDSDQQTYRWSKFQPVSAQEKGKPEISLSLSHSRPLGVRFLYSGYFFLPVWR